MRRASLLLAVLLLLGLGACTSPAAPAASPTPEPAPSPAATEVPAPSPSPTPAPEPSPLPTPEPAFTPPPTDAALAVALEGETVTYPAFTFTGDLTGDGRAEFSLLLPPEEAKADYLRNAWVFRCLSDPEAAGLELSFVAGTDTEELLPGFMDAYLSFTEIEFSESVSLGRTRGYVGRATASDGETAADAWLLDTEGGVVTAVFLRSAAAPGPEAAILSAMLDTFELLG